MYLWVTLGAAYKRVSLILDFFVGGNIFFDQVQQKQQPVLAANILKKRYANTILINFRKKQTKVQRARAKIVFFPVTS